MTMFAALDVSKKDTQVHVVDETGKCVWRRKVPTNPDDISAALQPYTTQLEKVGLETGSWNSWLYHGLVDHGFNVACMDARQAHAALSVTVNKTDANDAEGLAHLLRTGLFRAVRVNRGATCAGEPCSGRARRWYARLSIWEMLSAVPCGCLALTWLRVLDRAVPALLSAGLRHISPSSPGSCMSLRRCLKLGGQCVGKWQNTRLRPAPKCVRTNGVSS